MHFLYSLARIVVIDLVLSGDNAVVIGMAAHRLPMKQRRQAIVFGGGAAIVLRIVLTAVAALLLTIPGLQLVGGLLLIWIAFKLLKEEDEHENVKAAANLREAIFTILLADLIMSTDNVLGVAGASQGNMALLLFGLILSMAILMWMGSIVANLINRFGWLSYVGAAVIAWTGTQMIFEDPFVIRRVEWAATSVSYLFAAAVTILVTGVAHWFYRVRTAKED